MPDDDPIINKPQALAALAQAAFARATKAAIEENDRRGVPSYGGKDGRIVVRQPPPLTRDLLARLDRMTDDDIDYSDLPELGDEFFARAKAMTDPDEIDWSAWSREAEDAPAPTFDDLPTTRLCDFGENWLRGLLLQMVVEHCRIGETDELDCHGIAANADAMQELDGELIKITHQTEDCILATVTAEGWALLELLQAQLDPDNNS